MQITYRHEDTFKYTQIRFSDARGTHGADITVIKAIRERGEKILWEPATIRFSQNELSLADAYVMLAATHAAIDEARKLDELYPPDSVVAE